MKQAGFTVVEILIVILVIGILAGISTVGYNSVQTKAKNNARSTQLRQAEKLLALHYTAHSSYPLGATNTTYCLGTGYPNGRCNSTSTTVNGPYSNVETNTLFSAPLSTYGQISGPGLPVRNLVGPYIWVWASGNGFALTQVYQGEDVDTCPDGFFAGWNDLDSETLTCPKDYFYYE